jgi:hypothetical protein
VNANAHGGQLTVEMLRPDGTVLPGFERNKCRPLQVNSTCKQVIWTDRRDVGELQERPIVVRFYAADAQLFSFWFSSDLAGSSHGYVAAGGPGFTGPTDSAGAARI